MSLIVVVGIKQIFLKSIVNNIKIVLDCVYIPPINAYIPIFLNFLNHYLIIIGDFNFNSFD